ncbi:hypothetical protein Tco_0650657, partial [Tanacetum coccineum]
TNLTPPLSDDRDRDEESYASEFVDSFFQDDDDDSEKKDKKKDDDDDVNDDHTDHTLDKTQETGSLETRNEKMQTPITLPHRSPRTNLSLDKTISKELTNTISPSTTTTSQVIPKIASNATNDIIEDNLPKVIVNRLYTEEKRHNNVITVHPTTNFSTTTPSSSDLQQQLYLKMKRSLQDQAEDPELWEVLKRKFEKSSASSSPCRTDAFREHDQVDHQEDDAPPEGEKRVKRQKTSKSSKFARVVDEDEVIPKDKTPELIDELQNVDKRIPTIFDHARMEATLNDMMSNQFRNAEENPNEPPRYIYNKDLFSLKHGNTEEKSYILSLHKIHAVPFPEDDLEEKMNCCVRKEFKTFNDEARLSIQHWKDLWHKRLYKFNQRKVRDNPKEYFSNHRIVEVVRITTDQQHGLDYMEQIIVIRENNKPDSFSEADFKYLNKNDIDDLYYLCLNKKVNYRENKLLNSVITFIRSCVIWERVHDFHMGIESYQIRINLTTPTLIFPGIEACDHYSIVDKPTTGLIYLNEKEEKRDMYLVEIVKFCDATLERVLKEVKLKIFETEFWKKPSLLGKLDLDIMKAFKREITKRPRHREQMRGKNHL